MSTQSHSLANTIGADFEVEIDGSRYLISPIKLSDYAAAEQHLKKSLPNLVKNAVEATRDESPEIQEIAIRSAMREQRNQVVQLEDIDTWIATLDGVSFTFWSKIEQRYPGRVTLEQVRQFICTLSTDEFTDLVRRRDSASGKDALGNSRGPVEAGQAEPKQSTGEASSPSSADTPSSEA